MSSSSNTPFKTPLPYKHSKHQDAEQFYTPHKGASDSDESTTSVDNMETASTGSSNCEISIVAEFDDLMRLVRHLRQEKEETTNAFIEFVEHVKGLLVERDSAVDECKRLQSKVDEMTHNLSDLEHQLTLARRFMDREKIKTRDAFRERDLLRTQIMSVCDFLCGNGRCTIPDETRQKLSFLDNYIQGDFEKDKPPHLSTINEINSTGSMLSDFSYSRSEDDLDNSLVHAAGKSWKKHRPSSGGVAGEPATKKRRSSGNKAVEINPSDTVRATTTVTVTKDGPITATSVIEAVPKTPSEPVLSNNSESTRPSAPPADLVFESWNREHNQPFKKPERILKQHVFQQKTIVIPDVCDPCEKRLRFGRQALKCKECKATCHIECKDNIPLPCVPLLNTPTHPRGPLGFIGDYTPTTPPMVPAILIHCVNEIELRGQNEVGLYRVPGSERDVKALKEKFLKSRTSPSLKSVDINVICGVVKDFLRSLNEPLVTYKLWKDFVRAVEMKDNIDVAPALYQTISELPQPNRDTLAYMVLHLQRIASWPECKMNINNLARTFGPTIVGYSSDDPDPNFIMNEMVLHNKVMEYLLNIPSEYWASFVDIDSSTQPSSDLRQTPSTDSLLRPAVSRGFFTPNRYSYIDKNLVNRKQRFFASPR